MASAPAGTARAHTAATALKTSCAWKLCEPWSLTVARLLMLPERRWKPMLDWPAKALSLIVVCQLPPSVVAPVADRSFPFMVAQRKHADSRAPH